MENGFMMLKCIKDVIDSDDYTTKYNGYDLDEEKYDKDDVFMISSCIGKKYIEFYPDCFEEIIMEKEDWIELAKKRIEFAKYALIGRDVKKDSYLALCQKDIESTEKLIDNGIKDENDLFELQIRINNMPDKQYTYYYDAPTYNMKKAVSYAINSDIEDIPKVQNENITIIE